MPIKSTTTTEGGKKRKREKKSKRIYRTSQNIRIINVFLESRLLESFPSLGVTVHFTSLGCPLYNTVLISGPAVGAAQILICSYSSVFLPPMSTAIRTSGFSFVGVLNDVLYISRTQSLPSLSRGFNLQLVHLVEGFWVFFLSHTAPGFQLRFYFHLWIWVVSWGLLLRLPWRTWVCACVQVVQLFELQGFWQHQVLRGVGG